MQRTNNDTAGDRRRDITGCADYLERDKTKHAMKVVALNSSPNMESGGTASILNPFLEGMREAGADVELFYVHKLKINPCLGCGTCWSRTPGECVQKDDMQSIYPELAASDVIVFATPVYVSGMNSQMKAVLDRCYALLQPIFEIRGGRTRHSRREKFRPGKVVLVSACGHPELDNFDPLVAHMEEACKNLDREFAGALLRPIAFFLPRLKQMGVPVDGVYEAAREAGRQLARDGRMSPQTLKDVSRELVAREKFVQAINVNVQRVLDKLENR